MAHRKNVKRIDPRYFLNETMHRNDDGSALEEADDPLQAAMKRCGDKAKDEDEYDECMKGATPSGKPRSRNVQSASLKELEEGCAPEEGGAPAPVDDISQLSPEEAYAAGMAAARDAIDQAMGGPDALPPEGGFSGPGPFGEPVAEEE